MGCNCVAPKQNEDQEINPERLTFLSIYINY